MAFFRIQIASCILLVTSACGAVLRQPAHEDFAEVQRLEAVQEEAANAFLNGTLSADEAANRSCNAADSICGLATGEGQAPGPAHCTPGGSDECTPVGAAMQPNQNANADLQLRCTSAQERCLRLRDGG